MIFRRGYKLSSLLTFGCGGFLLLVLVGAFVLPSLVPLPQVDPVPDPQGQRPAEDNGWPLLQQAAEALRGKAPQTDYPRLTTGASRALLAYVDGNAAALRLLDQALGKPYLEIPRDVVEPMAGPDSFQYLGKVRELARLKVQRAYFALGGGDLLTAMDAAMDVVELGARLQNSGAALIDHLVGQAVTAVGYRAVRECAAPELTPAQSRPVEDATWPALTGPERTALESALARLVPEKGICCGAQRALAGEFQLCRGSYEHPERMAGSDVKAARGLARFGRVPNVVYDGPRTAAMAQERTLVFRRLVMRPRWERHLEAEPALQPASGLASYYNCMGRTLVGISEPTVVKWLDKLDRTIADNRLTCVVLAERLYLDRHGWLAPELAKLSEVGLPANKLVDPFDGQTLRYQLTAGTSGLPLEGALFCSVGPNGTLDTDRPDRDRDKRTDDVVVELPMRVPARR
jgi:hypothetical protein